MVHSLRNKSQHRILLPELLIGSEVAANPTKAFLEMEAARDLRDVVLPFWI